MKNNFKLKIKYNDVTDSYEVWISSDGGNEWDIEGIYPCVAIASDEEPKFVHFGLIETIREAVNFGYTVVY